ncbi:Putative ribonuclease H protein At1g65750 [Linum perenne]
MAWSKIVKDALRRDGAMLDSSPVREDTDIAWEPGPFGWCTVNTDGAVMDTSRRTAAAAGGLVRNADGRCLGAFTANLGCCSITRAEMRGAIIGLQLAWELGQRKVVLQVDSRAAIQLLQEEGVPMHNHAMEVYDFCELLERDWEVSIRHTYREGNHAADFLAGIGHGYPLGRSSIPISDPSLGYFLRYDCMRISETRSIILNN